MFWPLKSGTLNALEWFDVTIEKEIWQLLLTVSALFEFGLGDGGSLTEVAIAIEDLMYFVFYLGLKVEFFK